MKYFVTLNGRTLEVTVNGTRVALEGAEHQAELLSVAATPIRLLLLDGVTWSFPMEHTARGVWTVQANGERQEVEVLDERAAHIRSLVGTGAPASGSRSLRAPMPGLVVKVLATPGQQVIQGSSLIVLEAMKMENELKAAAAGIVERVKVSPGQTVEKGEVLVSFRAGGSA